MNLVDAQAPAERWALKLFSRSFQYLPNSSADAFTIQGFMRPLNAEELIAAAMQQGHLLVVDAAQFVVATGQETPRKYDRVIAEQRYAVETWHGSPGLPPFTFFKMTLLGGQQ